jgi:hypothetical protein
MIVFGSRICKMGIAGTSFDGDTWHRKKGHNRPKAGDIVVLFVPVGRVVWWWIG